MVSPPDALVGRILCLVTPTVLDLFMQRRTDAKSYDRRTVNEPICYSWYCK